MKTSRAVQFTAEDLNTADVPVPTYNKELGWTREGYSRLDQDVKNARSSLREQRKMNREAKRDPYAGVSNVQFRVPKIASMVLEGVEIISEGITTSVNDMVTEVVIQFIARDVKRLSVHHESSLMSYSKEELAELGDGIYQELQGLAAKSDAHETALEEGKNAANKFKDLVRERKEYRRNRDGHSHVKIIDESFDGLARANAWRRQNDPGYSGYDPD